MKSGKRLKRNFGSFFLDTFGADIMTVIIDYLGPLHLMSLVRADPFLRIYFKEKHNKTIYDVCLKKLHYYMVVSTSTRRLDEKQWNCLVNNPRNLNDYIIAGGDYLRRALTFEMFTVGKVNIRRRVSLPDLFCNMRRKVDDQFFWMGNKKTMFDALDLLLTNYNYVNFTSLAVYYPHSILHHCNVVNAKRIGYFVEINKK